MTTTNLEQILRDNPNLNREELEQVSRLLLQMRQAGRTRNVYSLSSRMSSVKSTQPAQNSEPREAVKLSRR